MMNQMFLRANRSTKSDHNGHKSQPATSDIEKVQETEVLSGTYF